MNASAINGQEKTALDWLAGRAGYEQLGIDYATRKFRKQIRAVSIALCVDRHIGIHGISDRLDSLLLADRKHGMGRDSLPWIAVLATVSNRNLLC